MGWASAIGVGIAALSQYTAGQDEKSILKKNKKIAGMNAQAELQAGRMDERAIREAGSQIIGEQRAAAASSGLLVNEGSALDVQMSTADQIEMDVLRNRYNRRRAAWGYAVAGENFVAQADAAGKQGIYGALGTGLQGYGDYLKYQDLKAGGIN